MIQLKAAAPPSSIRKSYRQIGWQGWGQPSPCPHGISLEYPGTSTGQWRQERLPSLLTPTGAFYLISSHVSTQYHFHKVQAGAGRQEAGKPACITHGKLAPQKETAETTGCKQESSVQLQGRYAARAGRGRAAPQMLIVSGFLP